MGDERVHVVLASDDHYAMPLATTAASALLSATDPSSVHVTVLDCGISRRNLTRITATVTELDGGVTIQPFTSTVPRDVVDAGVIPSLAAFARLFAAEHLVGVDRAVYLDSDTVVRADLSELLALLDDGNLVAGVADGQGAGLTRQVERLADFVDPAMGDSPYVNSGVLAIDVAAWREEGLHEVFSGLMARHHFEFADQDVINLGCAGRIRTIPEIFNVQTHLFADRPKTDALEALSRAHVIHYTERPKPWHGGTDPELARWWYESVDRTAWQGWRPTPLRLAVPKARRGWRMARHRPAAVANRLRGVARRERSTDLGRGLDGWHLYGLTTEDRPERQEHLASELQRTPLSSSLQVAARPAEPDGFSSTGARGCFESHLTSLRHARESGVDVAVMVEDDAVLARNFVDHVRDIEAELDDLDWAVLHLGYLGSQSPASSDEVSLLTPHVARAEGWEIAGTHLIAFHRRHLDAVIEDLESRLTPGGHKIPVDGAFNEFRRDAGHPTLLAVPNLGHQGPSPSGIMSPTGVRATLLDAAWFRTPLERVKRAWWDAAATAPPSWHVRLWNLRARMRVRTGSR